MKSPKGWFELENQLLGLVCTMYVDKYVVLICSFNSICRYVHGSPESTEDISRVEKVGEKLFSKFELSFSAFGLPIFGI